jgi:hypothetical protein
VFAFLLKQLGAGYAVARAAPPVDAAHIVAWLEGPQFGQFQPASAAGAGMAAR